MIDNREHVEWIVPTLAGMTVATARRFRRKNNEHWKIVVIRLIAHSGTCVIAGYIMGGVLNYFKMPNLIAPCCALAGLYGTMLVDWIEDVGFELLTEYAKNKLENKDRK